MKINVHGYLIFLLNPWNQFKVFSILKIKVPFFIKGFFCF